MACFIISGGLFFTYIIFVFFYMSIAYRLDVITFNPFHVQLLNTILCMSVGVFVIILVQQGKFSAKYFKFAAFPMLSYEPSNFPQHFTLLEFTSCETEQEWPYYCLCLAALQFPEHFDLYMHFVLDYDPSLASQNIQYIKNVSLVTRADCPHYRLSQIYWLNATCLPRRISPD